VAGPSFTFRLERVRALRANKQKLAELELAAAIQQRDASGEQLRDAEASLEHAYSERLAEGSGPLEASELRARQAFVERVEAERSERARDLSAREAEVSRRDHELAFAAREHKILNRLRDRRSGEHARQVASREQAAIDEIALNLHNRGAA